MIRAEVVFDDWKINVNGFEICIQHDYDDVVYEVYKNDILVNEFERSLEQAIAYCLEQSK